MGVTPTYRLVILDIVGNLPAKELELYQNRPFVRPRLNYVELMQVQSLTGNS